MTSASSKPPKKEKVKPQTPKQRLEANRYNQMMYGASSSELTPTAKKINFGATYLKHPKFQNLISAFKTGTNFQFNVSEKGKSFIISTDGTQLLFENHVLFYTRPLNKHEYNLLLDKTTMLRYLTVDAFVHLVFAVMRSFPELGSPQLRYRNNQFFWGSEELGAGIAEQGPNLLIGACKTHLSKAK